MKYLTEDMHHATLPDSDSAEFICPKCGLISQEDVIFLCNQCENSELVFQNGMYMCPSCLKEGENFQCMKCDSKEVKMRLKK